MAISTELRGLYTDVREELRGLGQEAGGIAGQFRELAGLETELARAEVREQIGIATRAAMLGVFGLVLASILAVFVFVTIMLVLDIWMPEWAAALVTTSAVLLLAAVIGLMAMASIKHFSPVPRRTIKTVREDFTWLLHLARSNRA